MVVLRLRKSSRPSDVLPTSPQFLSKDELSFSEDSFSSNFEFSASRQQSMNDSPQPDSITDSRQQSINSECYQPAVERLNSRDQLTEVIETGPPYPTVVLPRYGGYWVDEGNSENAVPSTSTGITHSSVYDVEEDDNTETIDDYKLEVDDTETCYREFFLDQEHRNYVGTDEHENPILLSIKDENESSQVRLIFRTKDDTVHKLIPKEDYLRSSPEQIAKILNEGITVSELALVTRYDAPKLIINFDEHKKANKLKFGVVTQNFGQITEEEIFANRVESPAFQEFLKLIGEEVHLLNFPKFRGGLDTVNHQTGKSSIFAEFKGYEIMFHVSTKLPFADNDSQQVARKRHIGNDMVMIIFQEENTPFSADIVVSHFLQTYIVVQVIDPNTNHTRYKVNVTARNDVPSFGPKLKSPSIYSHGPEFTEFLLTKLINAELASHRTTRITSLERRTRKSLFKELCTELPKEVKRESSFISNIRLFDTLMKTVYRFKTGHKSHALTLPKPAPRNRKSSTPSPTSTPDFQKIHTIESAAVEESDSSSLNSLDLEGAVTYADSDTGLESMSSAETPNKQCSRCVDSCNDENKYESIKEEVTRLKCDKLHLLRQNVLCQKEIKRLREKELQLQSDLATTSKEILRLRELLKDYSPVSPTNGPPI